MQSVTLDDWAPLQALSRAWAGGARRLRAWGLWGSARALAVYALVGRDSRPCLVVVPGMADAQRFTADLRFFGGRAVEFPAPEPRLWRGGRHREADATRAAVCHRLLSGEPVAIVATPSALTHPLPPPDAFKADTVRLGVGDSLDRELLLEALEQAGYERADTVVEVGQWSVRGGILDVFSPAVRCPARVEFSGDEIESIRLFDPTSQRSTEGLDQIVVLPLGGRQGPATLLAYVPEVAPVVLDSAGLLDAPPEDAPATLPLIALLQGRQRLELGLLPEAGSAAGGLPHGPDSADFDFDTRSVPRFDGQFRRLTAELSRWIADGERIRLVAGDAHQADRLRQILDEHRFEPLLLETLWGPERLGVVVGDCSGGFAIPAVGLVILTEEELFGARRRTLRRPRYERGAAIAAFSDLQIGDLVVHEDHGIGRYLGLRTMEIEDRDADFLVLEYAEGGQLYVPVDRLDRISKYLGAPTSAARLDRLGGAAWQRVKESVRASLREMAEDLLKLYAARSVARGRVFSPDTAWQREFEAAFRFEETADQLRAIEEVKADMEAERPMDRLIAGDVGYGKTEVALRAAFKAVADGAQVAILVPTTVLAQQHWATFSDRFGAFPARVELLSRFRSPKEQKAVVEGLKQGTVDVVIGTHRLLSKDVGFKTLGLLVVDEEHRFGVAHKERIKQFRATVDVLSLTATPIPRTLYMSLSGVRDLSVIETAPLERLPVETRICRFSRAVIGEALERELERGGQVFFVHNRVESLASMARFIQALAPEARVVMAHGQMPERELEAVMVKFTTGQADVLVSTAIVESGLDIPASNTILINRADRFGLAQLYQLRGRVGRERQQAYAYLLVPADGRVDEQAERRLRVLQELTELGSGFKLALRDLEIRGAGNLLGAAQHGHIAAVGHDLYTKLLDEAVRELKGDASAATTEPVVTVDVEGYLPETYVPEVHQRLALYKRLAGASDVAELTDFRAELEDRFGPLPVAVEQLLQVVGLRIAARGLGIEKLEARPGKAVVRFSPSTPIRSERLVGMIQGSRGRMTMSREYTLEAGIQAGDWPATRDSLTHLLAHLRSALALVLLALTLGGCASWVPGWVPFVGRKGGPASAKVASTPAAEQPADPARPGEPVAGDRPAPDDEDVMDRIVAVVNNDVITLTELRENVLYYKAEARQQDGEGDEDLARRLLGRLIESRLQLQEADRERIGVDEAELTEELAGRMKKLNASTEEDFESLIKKQGLTLDAVKKKLREQLLIAKVVRRKVAFRVSVTEQEVDRYFDDNREKLETGLGYRARHILITPGRERDEAAWEAARERAQAVFARLQSGADFAEVAKEVSQDGTAKDGGDLGSLKKGELAEEFESQILRLGPGQVSAPFRTDLGHHLVKLESRDSLEEEGLARVRQQIRDILFRQKYQARLDAWLKEIRQRAVIEIRI